MRLWVLREDTPSVAFLIPRKKPTDEQLVVLYLALPMGHVDSAPFLCMSTETIEDMANEAMGDRHHAPPHPHKTFAAAQAPDERGTEPHDDRQ